MFFEIKEWKLKGNFTTLKSWKYKCTKLSEWRSNLQNNLYWWWYIPHIQKWLEDLWYKLTSNKIHEDLKEILLQDKKLNEITWTYKKYVKSTADLNKKEFMSYLWDIENYVYETFKFSIPPHDFD